MGRPYDGSALAGFGRLGFPAVIPNYPPAVFPSFFSNCRRSHAPLPSIVWEIPKLLTLICLLPSVVWEIPKLLMLTCPSPSVDWEESVRPSRDMLDTLKAVRPSLRSHMPHDGLPSQTIDAHMPPTVDSLGNTQTVDAHTPLSVGRLGRVRTPKELRLPDEPPPGLC